MNKKTVVSLVTVLFFAISTLVGIAKLAQIVNTILPTAWDLYDISSEISYINHQASLTGWSCDLSTRYNILIEERNTFYQSENEIVRTFSNMFSVWKYLISILCISFYPLMFVSFLHMFKSNVNYYKRPRVKKDETKKEKNLSPRERRAQIFEETHRRNRM